MGREGDPGQAVNGASAGTDHPASRESQRRVEERFRRLVENLQQDYFFYSHGTDGVFTYVSPSIERVLGYTPAEFCAHFGTYLTDSPINERVYQHTELSIRGIQQPPYEVEIFHKDQSRHTLMVQEFPAWDDQGQVVAVEGLAHDMTATQRMLEAVRQSEEKHRALIEATGTGYVILDEGGRVLDANPIYVRLSGHHEREEILGRPVTDWVAVQDRPRHEEEISSCLERGWVTALEVDYVDAVGHPTPVEMDGRVVHSGGRVQILALCRDITSRKRMEEALRDREERYRRLAESSPDIIFTIGRNLLVTYANRRAADFLGRPVEDVVGRPQRDLFPPEIAARHERSLERVFETAETLVAENLDYGRHLETRLVPVRDPSGRVTSVLGISRDMTERKRTEEALIRAERLAAVGVLSAGIAHEYNNVHTAVIGYLELILRSPALPERERWMLNRVRDAARRGAEITKSLLAFSGSEKTGRRMCRLADIVADTLKLVRSDLESDGIRIVERHGSALPLELNDGQMGQVVLNLVINARHALLDRPHKQIEIETGLADGSAFLRVTDTGCGIPREQMDKLFLPFFTTKGEHAVPGSPLMRVKGTGLGLSVCHTIVREHGGEIDVESEVGVGSTFRMRLPAAPSSAARAAPPPATQLPAEPGRGHVLVLDDEHDIGELVREVLVPLGYSVVASDDGAGCLERHMAEPFDLVLLDLQMPRMNGRDFLRALVALPEARRPVCLVMSGGASAMDQATWIGLGASGVLAKPFTPEELETRVRQALAER
jgi:PAS domain S-box-containing protein